MSLRDDDATILAYEQTSGAFEAVGTLYSVDAVSGGSRLTRETPFEPPSTGRGATFGPAMIERGWRTQFDAVGSPLEVTDGPVDGASENRGVETGGD